ncbi:hypothetical protein M3568_16100 [Priestia flexa]|uniref:hypothetical protein n=1 Tax=Priestia flexa TaxID=86664 RepID=UPI000AF7929B|nr:hypothetical protein [Priestia flexa]MCM3067889.1 hypothetical protein [Priestia flexa]MED3823059.1 hypothetical protein [Priestia flexa]
MVLYKERLIQLTGRFIEEATYRVETFVRKIHIVIKVLHTGGVTLETNVQTSQNIRVVTKQEVSMRKLLNIIGIFIFAGLALTNLTNPLPSTDYTKEFLLFIGGSAITYYILVNIYFIGQIGRKVVLTILFLLGSFSIIMAIYLATNPVSH